MISAKFVVIIIALFSACYGITIEYLNRLNRNRPVPKLVKHCYDYDRYNKYFEYAERKFKLNIVVEVISFSGICIFVMMPFTYIENIAGESVYELAFYTSLLPVIIISVLCFLVGYYLNSKIERKYNLTYKTDKEYFKDFIWLEFSLFICAAMLIFASCYFGSNLEFVSLKINKIIDNPLKIIFIIVLNYTLYELITDLIEIMSIRKEYKVKELDDEEIINEVQKVIKGTKKKLKKIYVYNESKNSIRKDAFLLRRLRCYELYLSDNLVNSENKREVMSICCHELGHFKQKFKITEFIYDNRLLFWLIVIAAVIATNGLTEGFLEWIKDSFTLEKDNYILAVVVGWICIKPVVFLSNVIGNHISKAREYEADLEAVRQGYKEEIISSFSKMHEEEFNDINPHPIVEFLEYTHPGIYSRIKNVMIN